RSETSEARPPGGRPARARVRVPWRGPRREVRRPAAGRAGGRRGVRAPPGFGSTVRGWAVAGRDNDPSAGSPTENLLRLLLPLNDKVQWTSRDVAGGGPPASPRSEHFTGPFNR